MTKTLLTFAALALAASPTFAQEKTCLHVAAFAPDYASTSEIDHALKEKMKSHCRVETFYLDTKRNPSEEGIRRRALEARDLIAKTRPALVFTSDDGAMKALVVPHLKEAGVPVVFTGVKWSAESYGLPAENVTGVLDVQPLDAMVSEVKHALKARGQAARTVAILTMDTPIERAESPHVAARFRAAGLETREYWAKSMAEWKTEYAKAVVATDFVYLGTNVGALDWKDHEAIAWVKSRPRKLSASVNDWMVPLTTFVMSSTPAEQGVLGADQAKQILAGKKAGSIPIVASRQFDAYVNEELLKESGARLSDGFMKKAKPR